MYLPEQQKLLNPVSPRTATSTNDNGHTSGGVGRGPAVSAGRHGLTSEYRFIHQRIPERTGNKEKIFLPIFLLSLQVVFIILFAFFGKYDASDGAKAAEVERKYPMFQSLHVMVIIGFGFIMTYLKRYGYGSIGFNLLIVAFVIQWSLLVHGWINWNEGNGQFSINLNRLIAADLTSVAVIISFGVIIGTVTSSQLIVVILFEVVAQIANEFICINILRAHDVGRSMYVHLFGAMFGLGVSKALHLNKVLPTHKQSSVYHSDLFAFIGTLFLWVFFPSFNSLYADEDGQSRAVINTYLALTASTVFTIGVSSLIGKGKINPMHVQRATLAGGIAIGCVADLNLQLYMALIIGSLGGLISTLSYKYLTSGGFKIMKFHDTCQNFSLHGVPAILAGLLAAVFSAVSILKVPGGFNYDGFNSVYNETVYNSTNYNLTVVVQLSNYRSPFIQAGYQLAALTVTAFISLITGVLVGIFIHLPPFDQLIEETEYFDDEAQWITPDDYALKLTLARKGIEMDCDEMYSLTPMVLKIAEGDDTGL